MSIPHNGAPRWIGLLLILFGIICRAPVVRADVDWNQDGKPDLLFQNQMTGEPVYWLMQGTTMTRGGGILSPVSGYQIVDTVDLNADGTTYLFFQNTTTNQIAYWQMKGTQFMGGGALPIIPLPGYALVGAGDFNGDGHPDLVFQNQSTGQIVIWLLNGTKYIGSVGIAQVPNPDYHIVGIGDFNGDGWPDFVFQSQSTGQIVFWLMQGTKFLAGVAPDRQPAPGYVVAGLSDFNGDGKPDLVFQNPKTGELLYWILNGTHFVSGGGLPQPLTADWRLAGLRTFYPRPAVFRLETTQGLSALYGTVRIRIRNLRTSTVSAAVRVGSIAASAKIVYRDVDAPDTGAGGAIDFTVPAGLAAGAQNLTVTLASKDVPPYPIHVGDPNPFALFTIKNGTTGVMSQFVAELRADAAPNTVSNFVGLAIGAKTWLDPANNNSPTNAPLYNGTTFHRVIDGFIEQGGDPLTRTLPPGDSRIGSGGPGFTIPFEISPLTHVDGALAMARPGDLNSAGSQFFIDNGPQHFLDITTDGMGNPTGGYVVFGLVVEGLAVTKNITRTYSADGLTPLPGVIPDTLVNIIITGKIDTP